MSHCPPSFAVCLLALLSGCASLAPLSAGQIGCADRDIVITESVSHLGSRTWVATCKGRRYRCTSSETRYDRDVSCREEGGNSLSVEPTVAAPGCSYDTQCKGERLCKKGTCVDPNEPTPPAAPVASPAIDPAKPSNPDNHGGLITTRGTPLSDAQSNQLTSWKGAPVLVKTLTGDSVEGQLAEATQHELLVKPMSANPGLRRLRKVPLTEVLSIELK